MEMSDKRRQISKVMQRLTEIAPAGWQTGIHIRFAQPLYLRSTYPQSWQDHYATNAYSLRDPLVFWGISRTGTVRWSEITLPDPFGVMDKAREFGLHYGAVISCGKITSRTIVGIAHGEREFTDEEIAETALLTDELHLAADLPQKLTPAAVEALALSAEGLTSEDAAGRLGITEDVFEARLASACSTLGVRTTAEALRMAREFQLI